MQPGDFDNLIVLCVQDRSGAALVALAANTPVPGLVVLGAGLVNPVPENIQDRTGEKLNVAQESFVCLDLTSTLGTSW